MDYDFPDDIVKTRTGRRAFLELGVIGLRVRAPDRLTIEQHQERISDEMGGMTDKERAATFDPQVLVEHIDAFGKGLSPWEIKFINGNIDYPPVRYTKLQVDVIHRIYLEKCG